MGVSKTRTFKTGEGGNLNCPAMGTGEAILDMGILCVIVIQRSVSKLNRFYMTLLDTHDIMWKIKQDSQY